MGSAAKARINKPLFLKIVKYVTVKLGTAALGIQAVFLSVPAEIPVKTKPV